MLYGIIKNIKQLRYGAFIAGIACFLALGVEAGTHDGTADLDLNSLGAPSGVCVDKSNDRIYVCDTNNNRVLWWNNSVSLAEQKPPDGVLGQQDFYLSSPNQGAMVAANTLSRPSGVSVDNFGNVWVADSGNNRVLKYGLPMNNGINAKLVLGQIDFISDIGNSAAANTLFNPIGVSVDPAGNVWVADYGNNRVLQYNRPTSNGENADMVLGQENVISSAINQGGPVGANTLNGPTAISFDDSGNVWVVDLGNNRVLQYNNPAGNGVSASLVLGQSDFVSNVWNRSEQKITTANMLSAPYGVSVDASGNVWVTDQSNHRILTYNKPKTNGADATKVIGQADFAGNSVNRAGPAALNTLNFPQGISFDASDDVWIADSGNNRVLKYNRD
ncbi:MAG: NHL repeat-containing protein [Endomicrobiales bacterium]|jgi:sugar lactone lactonase YvrE